MKQKKKKKKCAFYVYFFLFMSPSGCQLKAHGSWKWEDNSLDKTLGKIWALLGFRLADKIFTYCWFIQLKTVGSTI